MTKTIARNESGRFQRDDAVLRDGMIELTELVKRVGCAWEMFLELDADGKRRYMDKIYDDADALIRQLREVDTRKGGNHVG